MKILAPVCSAKETATLISSGAGELYCGLHPTAWRRKYGERVWVNRRGAGAANVESINELAAIAEIARRHNVPVFLTLNMPYYPPEQYDEMLALVQETANACGIDAFIISDPGLIQAIKRSFPNMSIHVSSLAAVLNSASATFFRNLGAARIIFPRYIDTMELGMIIDKVGRAVEYEVFILNDGCVFEEGYCHVSHTFGGSFCNRKRSYQLIRTDNNKTLPVKESFARHLKDYEEWLWYVANCGGTAGPNGYPNGMCGLCALPELHKMGVQSLKIVGREAPLAKKIASVKLVKEVMDAVNAGEDPQQVKRKAKRLRDTPRRCNTGYMCYYR